MGNGVVVIGSLLDSFATVVKVIVRHVSHDHTHDTCSVRTEFGFSQNDNVICVGPNVVINYFPRGCYASTGSSSGVSSVEGRLLLVDRVWSSMLCLRSFSGGGTFGRSGQCSFLGGRACSKNPALAHPTAIRDDRSARSG